MATIVRVDLSAYREAWATVERLVIDRVREPSLQASLLAAIAGILAALASDPLVPRELGVEVRATQAHVEVRIERSDGVDALFCDCA